MDYTPEYYANAIRIIAVSEAFGLLSPQKEERKFWVHPYNSNREQSG